jgi:uncharacterized protein with FMN-binding domain
MNDNDLLKKKRRIQAGIALAAITLVIVGVVIATNPNKSDASSNNNTSTSTQTASNNTTSSGDQTYKDGTYTATGSYFSPGGQEMVKVTLTLNNNTVTASDVISGANDPTADSYQTIFIGGYKKYVVGKKIDTIKLSNVSGSSLTSQGFNDALKQIEQQAKA